MNLANLIPGVSGIRLAADVIGLLAICYTGYDLIYKPIEAHGERIGFSKGVEEQKKETYKHSERADAAEKALSDAQAVNKAQLDAVTIASNAQLAVMQADLQAAQKKATAALTNYQKAREDAMQALLKAKGTVVVPDATVPYYAPIDVAGLSKPGVDAVNEMVLK